MFGVNYGGPVLAQVILPETMKLFDYQLFEFLFWGMIFTGLEFMIWEIIFGGSNFEFDLLQPFIQLFEFRFC